MGNLKSKNSHQRGGSYGGGDQVLQQPNHNNNNNNNGGSGHLPQLGDISMMLENQLQSHVGVVDSSDVVNELADLGNSHGSSSSHLSGSYSKLYQQQQQQQHIVHPGITPGTASNGNGNGNNNGSGNVGNGGGSNNGSKIFGNNQQQQQQQLPSIHTFNYTYNPDDKSGSNLQLLKLMMKKTGAELVYHLLDGGPSILVDFLHHLHDQLGHNSIDIHTFIDKINHVFYLSDNFAITKLYLSSISKRRTCQCVWGPNSMFYRCKTCALSPNSSICYECFRNGPHEKEKHDFSTSFASYGGSCDCGSSDSWKVEGFCSNHSHNGPDEDPTKNMKPELLISTHLVIRSVLILLLEMNQLHLPKIPTLSIQEILNIKREDEEEQSPTSTTSTTTTTTTTTTSTTNTKTNSPSSPNSSTGSSSWALFNDTITESYSLELLDWLDQISKIGRSISHVLAEELCYQTLDPANLTLVNIPPLKFTTSKDIIRYPVPSAFMPPLPHLVLIDRSEIRTKLVFLLLYILCEHSFKFGFLQSYIRIYPRLVKMTSIETLYRFSPQVFSASPIVNLFARNYSPSLLDMLFDTTITTLGEASLNKHQIAIISDIKTIIQHPTVAHVIFFERRSVLLTKFINILRIIQGMDSMKRIKTQHLEYDQDDWLYAFQLDSEIRDISKDMVSTLTNDIPLEELKSLITFISKQLVGVEGAYPSEYFGVPVSENNLFDGSKPVSLILPLNRFYGLLLQKTMSLYPNDTTVKQLVPESINPYKLIMPFLLVQAFIHQVNNSYWVRNSDATVRRKSYLYLLFFFEIDLSIVQLLLSLVNVNEFLIFCSKEFGAYLPVVLRNRADDNNHRFYHYLKFAIQLYQERYAINDNAEYVKNSLIHLLCTNSKPHSKIESVMTHLDKASLYETMLPEIADEQPASGEHPASYKMKAEYWKYFNRYYPLFTPLVAEDSITSYLEYKKSNKMNNVESLPPPPPLSNLNSQYAAVGDIVHSDYLFYTILSLLSQFVDAPDPDVTEVMYSVNECLYLIVLSIQHSKPLPPSTVIVEKKDDENNETNNHDDNNNNQQQQQQPPIDWGLLLRPRQTVGEHNHSILCILQHYTFFRGSQTSTTTSVLKILIELLMKSHTNNIYLDKRDLLEKAVDGLCQYHPDIEKEVISLYPSYKKSINDDEVDQKVKDKLKSAKQRQAEIMAKFMQQQNKFLQQTTEDMMDEDDEMETDKDGTTTSKRESEASCVLCLKGHYSRKDPLSMIAMYQCSTLISFSKIPVLANLDSNLKKHLKTYLKYISFPPLKASIDTLNYTSSFHFRVCGHYIHSECFHQYSNALLQKAAQNDNFEGDHIIRPLNGEFLCPMCRRVSNIVIPVDHNSLVSNTSNSNNNNPGENTQSYEQSPASLSQGSTPSLNNGDNNSIVNYSHSFNNSPLPIQSPTTTTSTTSTTSTLNTNPPSTPSTPTSISSPMISDDIKNQLKSWFHFISQKSKVSSANSVSNNTKRRDNLEFFNSLNKIAFKGGNVDSISPYFLCQLVARNIEFLEIATREIQQPHQPPANNAPLFCIGNDIFQRDILTIRLLYKNIKDYIQHHNEPKYREMVIDLFKGKSEPILSIDPFCAFILFILILDDPNSIDIEFVTNISIDLFIIQFIITKIYSIEKDKKKKVSLIQMVLEFLSKGITSQILDDLERDIAPFLRSICLAYHCFFYGSSAASSTSSDLLTNQKRAQLQELTREDLLMKSKLFKWLDIESIEMLVSRQTRTNVLLGGWITQLERNINSISPFFVTEPRRPTFIDLPNVYHDIFIKYLNVPCSTCKTVPSKSAICLLCGHLICVDGNCCVVNGMRESAKHTRVCGIYRVGVFLGTKNPSVVLIRDHRMSVMSNAYLDQYGEPDSTLDRGKPLFRSDHNLQELWSSWISHSIDEKYNSNCDLRGREY